MNYRSEYHRCGKTFTARYKSKKYCSDKCQREQQKENHVIKHKLQPRPKISTGAAGAIGELDVCSHYLRMGYEVFRNVSPPGPADIMIWNPKTGEILVMS